MRVGVEYGQRWNSPEGWSIRPLCRRFKRGFSIGPIVVVRGVWAEKIPPGKNGWMRGREKEGI